MFKRSHICVSVALGAIVVLAGPVMAQSQPDIVIEPPEGSVQFGRSLASGGDADGDGHDDIFIADPGFEVDGVPVGRWFLYSGATQEALWSVVGDQPLAGQSLFEWSIPGAFIGDIDDDGGDDLIVGRPGAAESRGIVTVYSGRTGEMLFEYQGAEPEDLFGLDVAGVGDVDGDGVADFAFIGGPYPGAAFTSIRSGRDGSEIHRLLSPTARRVRGLGDLNRDGHDEVVVGSVSLLNVEPHLTVLDGRTRETYVINRPDATDRDFGYALATGGDLTGDGVPDLVTSGRSPVEHRAYVISGRTGRVHARITGVRGLPHSLWGTRMELADVTGDGRLEPLIAETGVGWHVVNPRSFEPVFHAIVHGGFSNLYFGNEWASGDVTDDGYADFVGLDFERGVLIRPGSPLLIENPAVPRTIRTIERGGPSEFRVYGARPGRAVHLLANRAGEGCTFIPRLGICIDLQQPLVRVAGGVTQADGMATITINVPPDTAPGPAWLQAIDPNDPARGPITSNVMLVEIVD